MRQRNNSIFLNPNELDVKDLIQQTDQSKLRFFLEKNDDMDNEKNSIILKIPYDSELKLVQHSSTYWQEKQAKYLPENTVFSDYSQNINISPYILGDNTYIVFELENIDSIVTVDYFNIDLVSDYLVENPFQFQSSSGIDYSNFVKTGNNYVVDIEVSTQSTIELPTIYYKGYTVQLFKTDGTVENIDATVSENGFLQVNLENSGTLSVAWTGTKCVDIGILISIIGCILFLLLIAIILLVPKSFWDKFRRNIHDFCEAHCTIMEVMRFLVIGAIATIIDWVFMAIVMYAMEPTIYESFVQVIIGGASNPSTLSTVIGTGVGALIGMVVSYIFSVIFVFKEKGNSKSVMGFAMFIFLSLIGLGLHMWGMFIGYNLLHYNEWFVKIVMSVVVLIYNYISKRIIIFNNKRKSVVAKSIIKD